MQDQHEVLVVEQNRAAPVGVADVSEESLVNVLASMRKIRESYQLIDVQKTVKAIQSMTSVHVVNAELKAQALRELRRLALISDIQTFDWHA